MVDDLDPDKMLSLLGSEIYQRKPRKVLEPQNDNFSKVELYFENLKAGDNLLTTIKITLKTPWTIQLEELEKDWGTYDKWLPRSPGRGRPRKLQFTIKTAHCTGKITIEIIQTKEENNSQILTIKTLRLRRIYPYSDES